MLLAAKRRRKSSCKTAVLKYADHQYGEDSRVHPCLNNARNGNVLKDALLL
jgi:hypothetical protein